MSVQFSENPDDALGTDAKRQRDILVELLLLMGVKGEKRANIILVTAAGLGIALSIFLGLKAYHASIYPTQAELIKQASSYSPLPSPNSTL